MRFGELLPSVLEKLRVENYAYNIRMEVEWDSNKADINLKKHGVRFSDAEVVLSDPNALSSEDATAQREQRFIVIGMDHLWRLLVVVYTHRGNRIRLISARPATRSERFDYEAGI